MRQVAVAANPDSTIFVMDGSIGQAAQEQARAFRDAVDVGAVILTKMDGGARGTFFVSEEVEVERLRKRRKKKLT